VSGVLISGIFPNDRSIAAVMAAKARSAMKTRKLLIFALLVCLAAVAVSSIAHSDQATSKPPSDKIVNLELKDVSVEDAIHAIFRDSGIPYVVRPGVSGKVKELKLRGLTVDDAIKALVDAAKLALRVENGVYIIEPKAGSEDTATRVTIGKRTATAETQAEQKESLETSGAGQSSSIDQQSTSSEQQLQAAEGQEISAAPGYYPYPAVPFADAYGYYPYYYPYMPPYQLGQIQIFTGRRPPIIISEPGVPPSAFRGRLGGPRRPIVPYGPIGGWIVPEVPIVPYPYPPF
jgi:hypothetical protein